MYACELRLTGCRRVHSLTPQPLPADIAKLLGSPIIHVNGDSPESCARAARAAQAFRTQWQRDVVIDLIVYRRWGHNELDEPGFTQPSMYKAIRSRRSVPESYETTLKVRRSSVRALSRLAEFLTFLL